MAVAELFVALKTGIVPEPLATKPMLVLLLAQVNTAPIGLLTKLNGPTTSPGQSVILGKVAKLGDGFTTIACETVVVPHSLVTASVTVYVPGVE